MLVTLTDLALGALLGIGLILLMFSRVDRKSGCFYSLLMLIDVALASVCFVARLG